MHCLLIYSKKRNTNFCTCIVNSKVYFRIFDYVIVNHLLIFFLKTTLNWKLYYFENWIQNGAKFKDWFILNFQKSRILIPDLNYASHKTPGNEYVPEVLNIHVNETNTKIYFFRRIFFRAVTNELLRKKMWFYLILFLL